MPVGTLAVLDEEQAQLHALERHVCLEIPALVLTAGLGTALVHRHDFLPCMPASHVLVFPVPVLRHADDVKRTSRYLAQPLDEVYPVKPAVSQEVCRAYPALP